MFHFGVCSISWFYFDPNGVTGKLSRIWQQGWALMVPTLSVYIYELPATMLLDNIKRRYSFGFLFFFFLEKSLFTYLKLKLYLVVTQVKDYDAALDLELDSMEKFVLQCLAFYQVFFFFYKKKFEIVEIVWLWYFLSLKSNSCQNHFKFRNNKADAWLPNLEIIILWISFLGFFLLLLLFRFIKKTRELMGT